MRYNIEHATLGNGMEIFHINVPSDDISVIANVNAGPVYETDANAGISHLIEHMIFNGTHKRASRKIIDKELALMGDQYDLEVSPCSVKVKIRVMLADFEKALDLVSDTLFNAAMDSKVLEKEKKIVLDEMRNEHDEPDERLPKEFYAAIFKGCELSKPVLGFKRTVKALKHSEVVDFYRKHFNPSNTTLFVVGPKTLKEVVGKAIKYFPKAGGKKCAMPKVKVPENRARKKKVRQDLKNSHLLMGMSIRPSSKGDFYALKVLEEILSMAIFNRLGSEESLSYEVSAGYDCYSFIGLFSAGATFEPKDYARVTGIIKEELSKANRGEISRETVANAIKSVQTAWMLENPTTMDKAGLCHKSWLDREISSISQDIEAFEKVTLEQVKEAARKHLKVDDMTEVILGPKK